MNRLPGILSFVFESMVVFFVPAIVWTVLIAGCYQLVRDQIRRLFLAPQSTQELAQKSTG